MELQELQELLRELLQALQSVMESGEEIPDDFQGEIAITLQRLISRIEELTQQGAGEPPISPPGGAIEGDMQPSMPSSNVEGFAYDDKSGKLYVRFLGKHPNRNGPVYSYDNVPPVMYELFRRGSVPARTNGQNKWGKWWKGKVPSMGASVHTLLKLGGFPYRKVA